MKTILLGVAILFGSASFAQDVKPTLAQCEHDSAAWIDNLNKTRDYQTLSFNNLVARAKEMDTCRFTVVPKPNLEAILFAKHLPLTDKQIADANMEYATQLEDWINYERLSWAYIGEAAHRSALFIRENKLDERFWQFNSGYTKANQ